MQAKVRLSGVLAELDRVQAVVLGLFVTGNVLVPLLLFLHDWPWPWHAFVGDDSPIDWFSSVQCVLIGGIALTAWALSGVGRKAGTEPVSRRWPWLAFALGFVAMAVDERFRGHELIREKILEPHGVFTDVEYLLPGDVALIGYVVVGTVLAGFLLPELRRIRASLILFIAAIVLIGISAVQDSLDLPFSRHGGFRRVQIIAEELAEVWAELLFALSFLLLVFRKLRLLLQGLGGGTAAK